MAARVGFDSGRYLQLQLKAIFGSVAKNKAKMYIEFGGKLLDDKHAARVLPGYAEDAKMQLLSRLVQNGADVVFVISAKDILRGRMRGDHKIPYDQEAVRLIDGFEKYSVAVTCVVISLVPDGPVDQKIKHFQRVLNRKKISSYLFREAADFEKRITDRTFENNPFIQLSSGVVCVISPGGGSGKFGVCLSQIWKEMEHGTIIDYLKLETFPLKKLIPSHPVNLAFMAASADFYDFFFKSKAHTSSEYGKGRKEELQLLAIANKFPQGGRKLRRRLASRKTVDLVSDCIVDSELVEKEASAEIARRLIRYKYEVQRGEEAPSILLRMRKIISVLCATSS